MGFILTQLQRSLPAILCCPTVQHEIPSWVPALAEGVGRAAKGESHSRALGAVHLLLPTAVPAPSPGVPAAQQQRMLEQERVPVPWQLPSFHLHQHFQGCTWKSFSIVQGTRRSPLAPLVAVKRVPHRAEGTGTKQSALPNGSQSSSWGCSACPSFTMP